jgi:diguanylate cyclase (GGDEF)-like protein
MNIDGYLHPLNDILKHYYSLFKPDEVQDIFRGTGIHILPQTGVIKKMDPETADPWNRFFETIVTKKGFSWLALIEKDLKKITLEYGIEYPDIYSSRTYELELKNEKLEKELAALIDSLEEQGIKVEGGGVKDPLARVYKEDVFRENLLTDIVNHRNLGIDFGFFMIEIDNLPGLNMKYGRDAGDEMLVNTSYLLRHFKKKRREYAHHLIFRMNGPRFTYYCNDVSRQDLIGIAEEVRTAFRESMLFITGITVSIGLVHSDEFASGEMEPSLLESHIIELAASRLRLARHRGADSVCSESGTDENAADENYIMVIDPDVSVRYMLETHLSRVGFSVLSCAMGDEALEKIDIRKPMAIISGLMLPKMDAFSLRKKLMEDSSHKNIPFILTSAVKDENSIIRAQSLGIYHYFKRPFSIVEIVGLVKSLSIPAA